MLETLFEVAHLEEKEARRIFSMDGSVATAEMVTPMIFSSITDAEGFTVVSRRGGTSSSPSQTVTSELLPSPFAQGRGKGYPI